MTQNADLPLTVYMPALVEFFRQVNIGNLLKPHLEFGLGLQLTEAPRRA